MKRSSERRDEDLATGRKQQELEKAVTHSRLPTDTEFIVEPRRFVGQFPYFRQPKEIAGFSLDHKRKFHHDRSQLRLFAPPANPEDAAFDLRAGYNIFARRDEMKKDCLDDLLRCVLLNSEKFLPSPSTSGPNGVAMRYVYLCMARFCAFPAQLCQSPVQI